MRASQKPKSSRWIVVAGLLLALSCGIFVWLTHGNEREVPRAEEPAPAPPPDVPAPAASPTLLNVPVVVRPPPASARSLAPNPPEPQAAEDLLINPADPDAQRPEGGPLHPHPITPRHERIFRENALIGALFGAMDVNDGAGVRKLADQYRKEYPEDPNQLQKGYDIIADCLEHPGPESRAAGQQYYDVERGSILRRFVARHCLGFEL